VGCNDTHSYILNNREVIMPKERKKYFNFQINVNLSEVNNGFTVNVNDQNDRGYSSFSLEDTYVSKDLEDILSILKKQTLKLYNNKIALARKELGEE
jgi:hypothetical protein